MCCKVSDAQIIISINKNINFCFCNNVAFYGVCVARTKIETLKSTGAHWAWEPRWHAQYIALCCPLCLPACRYLGLISLTTAHLSIV
jgi:hypothetical protein